MDHTSYYKKIFRNNLRNIILIAAILLLILVFSLLNPVFIGLESMMNIARNIASLSIISIGMALVILTGGIDLTVGSNLALSGTVAAIVINATNSAVLGFIAAMLTACSVGFINGFIIGKLKINAIITTLALLGMARSVALVISDAITIRIKNDIYNWLGGYSIRTGNAFIPISMFFVIALFILFYFLMDKSVFGKRLSAIGGNEIASKIAGLMVEKNIMMVYVITGALVGFSGIIAVGRVSSAAPLAGMGMEFEAVTAVILGGASISGGKLDLKGTFLGVILLGVIINGLKIVNMNIYFVDLMKGVVLLLAVLANTITEKFQTEY